MDISDLLKTGLAGLGSSGGGQTALLGALTSLLGAQGGGQTGGLGGLVQAFQNQGLGDIASSWVGTGPNMPVSPDQITQALGRDGVGQFANNAGIPADSAGALLASVLPMLVDRLTPDGALPQAQAQGGVPGLDALKGLLGM